MTKKLNDVQRAKLLLKILEAKGQLDVYDIMLQFDISYTRAIPIMKLVRKLCEAQEEEICTYDEKDHRLLYLGKRGKAKENKQQDENEREEIDRILNAKPEGE
jgi:hypothetical protein